MASFFLVEQKNQKRLLESGQRGWRNHFNRRELAYTAGILMKEGLNVIFQNPLVLRIAKINQGKKEYHFG